MNLFIEIIEGEPLGKRFKLADAIKIGRRNCEIQLDDLKVSSVHATIYTKGTEPSLKFYLKDAGSSNGIKVKGQKVPELYLALGVEFKLGNIVFRVVDPAGKKPKVLEPKPLAKPKLILPAPELKPPPKMELGGERRELARPDKNDRRAVPRPTQLDRPPPKPSFPSALPLAQPRVPPLAPPAAEVEIPQTWQQILMNLIQNAGLRAEDFLTESVAAFNPPLKLSCIRGIQYGKSWLFGYGPRQVGPKSLDLMLNELSAPPICFQVIPTPNGVEFKTQHPKVVKVNGQEVTKVVLQAGDVIEVLNSQLVVDFDHARN